MGVSPAPGAPAKAKPSGAPAAAVPRPAEEPARVIAIPLDLVLLGVLGLVIVIGVLWWIFGRSKPAPAPPPPVTMTQPLTPPAAIETSTETPAVTRKPARAEKPAEKPALPAGRAANPNAAHLDGLRRKAQQAFFTERYVLPADSSALTFVTQALAIDPNDAYSRSLLENAVGKGKDQVQRALTANDLGTARRVADTMFQLLPGRKDVAALRSQVAAAEAADADHRAASASVGVLNYNLYHMHTDKAPADGGPYCQGVLIVKGQTMRFTGKSATDGNAHTLDFNCASIREIGRNRRVASNQNGFHIRTDAANFNFVPADGSPTAVTMLSAACGQ